MARRADGHIYSNTHGNVDGLADNDAVTINFYPFEYDNENPVALQNVVITTNQIITSVTGTRYTTLRLKPGEPFDFILIPTDKIPPGTILEQ